MCIVDKMNLLIICFFQYSATRLIWGLMKCAFSLNSTPVMTDVFGRWIKGFSKHDKQLVLVGVATMFWMTWRCRGDIIF